jgi:ligand-binding SRPBCC domain-containing protein
VRGPFALMRHEHTFEGRRTGTLMTDVFVYRAPLGPLGRLADALFLEWYMRRLLVSRAAALKRAAEASEST